MPIIEDFEDIAAGLNRIESEKKAWLESVPVDQPVEEWTHSVINYDPLAGNWIYQKSS